MTEASNRDKLLGLLGGKETPTAEELKQLVLKIDSHEVLAKVFLLEGLPFVFGASPMKYVIFREQVAERFSVGSQDVCIVGSAKLGYSPSPHTWGVSFSETSDVDVVVITEGLFYRGSRTLFTVLDELRPPLYELRQFQDGLGPPPVIPLENWRRFKEATRNFVYENFNPGLLPPDHPLRIEIFSKISTTAGLFLALEPKVFVSKIRCRIFRNWKAAESYYTNSLREARNYFQRQRDIDVPSEDEEVSSGSSLGGEPERVSLQLACPGVECGARLDVSVPGNREVSFVVVCSQCRTHTQFAGSAKEHSLADLGRHNGEFACPYCGETSRVWISPDRDVRFIARCEACDAAVSITGTKGNFSANTLHA